MHVQRAKLIADTLRSRCAKQLPQVYGEKVTLEGSEANPLQVQHSINLDEMAGRLSREERELITELIDRRKARQRAKQEQRKAIGDKTIEGTAEEVPDED